ncbi:MAG TPA: carbonic anhydrase, partial [Firmicutes bacterium]|nr:carbonic anhydrase [Bacillota bacterium]
VCISTITLVSCSKEPTYVDETINIKTPEDALARLKEGNMRFVQDQSQLINISSAKRLELEEGQHPYAVVISCSDSRVDP